VRAMLSRLQAASLLLLRAATVAVAVACSGRALAQGGAPSVGQTTPVIDHPERNGCCRLSLAGQSSV
jgi:hypothetical protein